MTFPKKMQSLVERYNEIKEADVLRSKVIEEFTEEIIDLYHALKKEKESFAELVSILKKRPFAIF